MKKFIGISIVAVLALLVVGVVGLAYAQDDTPAQPIPGQDAFGQGRMGGGRSAGRGGMHAGQGIDAAGPMHTAMIATLGEAFGMTPEALQARLDAGETMWQVAEGLGWTSEQLQVEMQAARSSAIQQAVADGTLTQEQADFMSERMSQRWQEGYGPGSAGCEGSEQGLGRHHGRGFGMRGLNQAAP